MKSGKFFELIARGTLFVQIQGEVRNIFSEVGGQGEQEGAGIQKSGGHIIGREGRKAPSVWGSGRGGGGV